MTDCKECADPAIGTFDGEPLCQMHASTRHAPEVSLAAAGFIPAAEHVPAPLAHRPNARAFVSGERMVVAEGETRDAAQASGAWLASAEPVEVRR